jgi:diguanylate cyclase (GGDEF)-like protein
LVVVVNSPTSISTEQPRLTPRKYALTVVVGAAALGVLGRSAGVLVGSSPSRAVLVGMLVLALLVWVAERMPVPIEGKSVSLSFVFVVCAAVMFGAAATALITAVAVGIVEFRCRMRVVAAYNTGSWALVAAASGIAASFGGGSDLGLLLAVVLASAALFVTNMALIAIVTADLRLRDALAIAWSWARPGFRPFVLSVSVVPLFVECWRTSHLIAIAAGVPLFAIGLHLRSAAESREATMLALTDPLTGLGNRRHLDERLQQELARADDERVPLSLCLIDLDDFKSINDRYGHETGDLALITIAETLRQGGEAFRLGGDEFALLLPRHSAERAVEVATAVSERVQTLHGPRGVPLSISTGTATYPTGGHGRDDLLRVADKAAYAEKARRRRSESSRRLTSATNA